MPTIIDTHVHLHPGVDFSSLLSSALFNAQSCDDKAGTAKCSLILCLTERKGESFFKGLVRQSGHVLLGKDIACEHIVDNKIAKLLWRGEKTIYLVSGRQIVTKEKLEVLALFCVDEIQDGVGIDEALKSIRACGGVPVLPWSPGKWLFRRGKQVRRLLTNSTNIDFLIGDIAIRPSIFPESGIFKLARRKGFGIVCGTDPLPIVGDERSVASYFTFAKREINEANLVTSIKEIIQSRDAGKGGRRNGLLRAGIRWIKAKLSR